MKIKYRRFDDNDYTEVECYFFDFRRLNDDENKTVLLFYKSLLDLHEIENVCEVCIEEI